MSTVLLILKIIGITLGMVAALIVFLAIAACLLCMGNGSNPFR